MIWVSDTAGDMMFVKSDWEALTGQSSREASGRGWLEKVHPDDRPLVADLFRQATGAREQFVLNCRLSRTGGDFCWIVASGAPSVWPESGEFLGYLGDLDVIEETPARMTAGGQIGSIRPPSEMLDGAEPTLIEGLADQVLHVRDLAHQADETTLVKIIDLALIEIGFRLAQQQTEPTRVPIPRPRLM